MNNSSHTVPTVVAGRAVPQGEPGGLYDEVVRPGPPVLLQVDRQLALSARGGFPQPLLPPDPAGAAPHRPPHRTTRLVKVSLHMMRGFLGSWRNAPYMSGFKRRLVMEKSCNMTKLVKSHGIL